MSFRFAATALLLVTTTVAGAAQDRFGDEHSGMLKGFTRSPTEHVMNEFDGMPELRSVRGRITVLDREPREGILFELRSEDPNSRVRGVLTKADGRFHIKSIKDGIYVFKATQDGFQSVYGKLKVTHKALRKNMLLVNLRIGN
jgi:hypothetical protein